MDKNKNKKWSRNIFLFRYWKLLEKNRKTQLKTFVRC